MTDLDRFCPPDDGAWHPATADDLLVLADALEDAGMLDDFGVPTGPGLRDFARSWLGRHPEAQVCVRLDDGGPTAGVGVDGSMDLARVAGGKILLVGFRAEKSPAPAT